MINYFSTDLALLVLQRRLVGASNVYKTIFRAFFMGDWFRGDIRPGVPATYGIVVPRVPQSIQSTVAYVVTSEQTEKQ